MIRVLNLGSLLCTINYRKLYRRKVKKNPDTNIQKYETQSEREDRKTEFIIINQTNRCRKRWQVIRPQILIAWREHIAPQTNILFQLKKYKIPQHTIISLHEIQARCQHMIHKSQVARSYWNKRDVQSSRRMVLNWRRRCDVPPPDTLSLVASPFLHSMFSVGALASYPHRCLTPRLSAASFSLTRENYWKRFPRTRRFDERIK